MFRFFILFTCCALLFSCSKSKEQASENPCDRELTDCNTQYVPIDTGMNGFFFLPGSYWIYRNDSLNADDSVVLISLAMGCQTYAWYQHQCDKVDYYRMNFVSYRSKTTWYDIIEGDQMMRNYDPYCYDWWKGWGLYWLSTTLIDSMSVGNNTFYKIEKSSSVNTSANPGYITAYTAKDIGIIRKVNKTNPPQTWDLVRWKIYR